MTRVTGRVAAASGFSVTTSQPPSAGQCGPKQRPWPVAKADPAAERLRNKESRELRKACRHA